jgi:hypothetical protein
MTERQRFSLELCEREGIVQPIVAQLAQHPEILAVVLYGSFLNREDSAILILPCSLTSADFRLKAFSIMSLIASRRSPA